MAISMGTAIIGGSIASGLLGANASKRASNASERSAQLGVDEQRRQFDITQEKSKPWEDAGLRALERQQILMGLQGATAQQQGFNAFAESPGQRFLQERARKNLLRSAAAIGGLGGGNVRSALVEQGVGFAQQDYQNEFARLGQIAGQGQAMTQSLGNQRAAMAGNVQQGYALGGQARASGIMNQNSAIQSGISGITSGLSYGLRGSSPAAQIDPFAGGYSASNLNLSQTPLGVNTNAGSFGYGG